ncbi:hypothetical protein D1B17_08585 [Companilactobacillus zhachilii]|uniref:DUF2479 domain-containing protein n=1 Tax=Companilactobacillus zhachilii TaxID=2304606 RepID=A0A386PW24_9LACO|nr:hypothetical protein [Companilactobacillus zhachilii]AYE38680.1 hypothetical protein D1B17_08585 [Companilactobacillus zhachilii]
MADSAYIKYKQSQDAQLPPLNYDNGADHEEPYDNIETDIPLEQPLLFNLQHSKAFYLPHSQTDDESDHITPQTIVNPATRARILPVAFLRQGEANSHEINMTVLDGIKPADLSEYKMFSIRGYDSQWHLISTDENIDTTDANIGELHWKPEEAVALTAGKYHTIQLVIESEDRTTTAMTLDFDLHIIPNNVAFPRPMAFYISEMQRALFNVGQLTGSAYKNTSFMVNFMEQVVRQALADFNKSIDDAIADFTKQTGDMQTKANGLNDDLETLKGKETDYETNLNKSLADLKTQMAQLDLVTQTTLKDDVTKLFANDDIDITITPEAQAILDDIEKEDTNGK